MRVRRLLRVDVVAIGTAALALASAGAVNAGPQARPEVITMVNGAGKTITIPKGALRQASSAGDLGTAPPTTTGPTKSGGMHTDDVIGGDGRVQELYPNDRPWSAIAHLSTDKGDCTGFMMSRDVLVTAGHCVYRDDWVRSYRVVPAKQGSYEPYGSCGGGVADVWVTSDYWHTRSPEFDYGLIKLTCDIGNTVGWFPSWDNTGENLVDQFFYVEGYPGDKPYGTMWWHGDVSKSQNASRLWYQIDTKPGQSGAPIYRYNSVTPGKCWGWCVTGINTSGKGWGMYNSGIRFNSDVMSFINFWISQP
jgi:glutamyl endopeptidase